MSYKSVIACLWFALACSILAAPDGLVSFNVSGSTLNCVTQHGILDIASRLTDGAFQFILNDENGSTDYEITVTDDGNPIAHQIKNRCGSGFTLVLWRLTAGEPTLQAIPYDPDVLCTVTVSRIPDPE